MPAQKRHKTKYPGVYYIEGKAVGSGKNEKIYYIMYRKDGKQIHEKAGRQFQDDMTPARAAQKRTDRIQGREPSNQKKREIEETKKREDEGRWTIDRLASEYFKSRPVNKAKSIDKGRYEKYLEPHFESKVPKEVLSLDIKRVQSKLEKSLSPQTVKHVLNLFTWIINFGVKNNLCEGISFHIKKPSVNNLTTEDLSGSQIQALLKAIEADDNIQIKNLMKMALYTGMRRGELFKLKWDHVDFERGFIHIKDPKGGPDQVIPLNDAARDVLESHPKSNSPYIFPGDKGKQRVSCQAGVNKIKTAAGLPSKFRPMHGLRHVYASILASSGEVDMYHLQRLLTHKDPRMTQRYAHLRDDTLKRASNLAGTLLNEAISKNNESKENVVTLSKKD